MVLLQVLMPTLLLIANRESTGRLRRRSLRFKRARGGSG